MSGGPSLCPWSRAGILAGSSCRLYLLQVTAKPAGNTTHFVLFLDPQDVFRTSEAKMEPAVEKCPALFDMVL